MKKLFVLFVAVAATISFAAKTNVYFSRPQFQWSHYSPVSTELEKIAGKEAADFDVQVTAPLVYKGTISYNADWIYEPDDRGGDGELTYNKRSNAKCIIENKGSYPAFLTLCLPCIDCYPCENINLQDGDGAPIEGILDIADEDYVGIDKDNDWGLPGYISNWKLYVVYKVSTKKNEKEVQIARINLLQDANTLFFTGPKGKNFYAQLGGRSMMSGKKSVYKFKFFEKLLSTDGKWYETEDTKKEQTAEITSPSEFKGNIQFSHVEPANAFGNDQVGNGQYEIINIAGTIKLSRDNSWTKKAVEGALGVQVTKDSKKWSDCIVEETATNCEEYFDNEGLFEQEYIEKAYPLKKYDDNVNVEDKTWGELLAYAFTATNKEFSFIPKEDD